MFEGEFWKGKKVFLTGHTGFKGSWLSLWLNDLGADVKGYALSPVTTPCLFNVARVGDVIESDIGDIRDLDHLKRSMQAFNPDILIHMAAQPLVRLSYKEPVETYETNVMGTVKVLEAARSCAHLKAIVSVTTDSAELVTSAYRRSFMQEKGVGLASARAGNVIGGGDWSDDRLIPDILRAFEKNEAVVIRNPKSTRPWQHVLEPLSGYLLLAQKLYEQPAEYAEGWNFGPHDDDAKPVDWILNRMVNQWGDGASWALDSGKHPHEAGYLKLDVSKAKSRLGWQPTWHLEQTLEKIVDWHQAWLNQEDMQALCLKEIQDYMQDEEGN